MVLKNKIYKKLFLIINLNFWIFKLSKNLNNTLRIITKIMYLKKTGGIIRFQKFTSKYSETNTLKPDGCIE